MLMVGDWNLDWRSCGSSHPLRTAEELRVRTGRLDQIGMCGVEGKSYRTFHCSISMAVKGS